MNLLCIVVQYTSGLQDARSSREAGSDVFARAYVCAGGSLRAGARFLLRMLSAHCSVIVNRF